MKNFFEAQSVAVIGVSSSPMNMGRAIVYNLLQFQFPGVIYLVGPKGGAFMGHKIFPSLLDIPDSIDIAAVLTPAHTIPDILRQCGQKGIKRVVIESSGFSEFAEERKALEEEILAIADKYDMRFIGPNGIGLIDIESGIALPFMPFEYEYPRGKIAVLAQSGGVGASILNALAPENIGFSKFVSLGNKLNVNENDLMEYLQGDTSTGTIFLYLEGIANGRRLLELSSRSTKPIVVLKSNNTNQSSAIARSHSASLTTDSEVAKEAFKQAGIFYARDLRESLDYLKAFELPAMKGKRLSVISRSGGHAVLAADAAAFYGFDLVPFPRSLLEIVEKQSRAKVIRLQNPLDLGDLFDLPLYLKIVDETLAQPDVDGVCFIHNYQGIFEAEASRELTRKIKPIMDRHNKPIAFCLFTTNKELLLHKKSIELPIFNDPWEAIKALNAAMNFSQREIQPFIGNPQSGIGMPRARVLIDEVSEKETGKQLPAALSYQLLAAYGIHVAPWRIVENADMIMASLEELGFPVVLKTADPQVLHKSDEGGVFLDLNNRIDVLEAFGQLQLRFGPEVLMQKQVTGGIEVFMGVKRDTTFGPVVMFGLGGIYVELFRDISRRVAPVSPRVAMDMIAETGAYQFLKGFRGHEEADIEACIDMLVRLSHMACDIPEIDSIDLNPVNLAMGHEKGAKVLDCRMIWV